MSGDSTMTIAEDDGTTATAIPIMKPKPGLSIVCSLGAVVVILFAYQFMERKSKHRGRKPKAHLVYWLGVTALMVATHSAPKLYALATYFFDRLTMTCVATVFPVYESLYAICTVEEDDDKKWYDEKYRLKKTDSLKCVHIT